MGYPKTSAKFLPDRQPALIQRANQQACSPTGERPRNAVAAGDMHYKFHAICRHHSAHVLTHARPARVTWASQIGRAHVCTPVTNAQLVCRLLLEKKNMMPTRMTTRTRSH